MINPGQVGPAIVEFDKEEGIGGTDALSTSSSSLSSHPTQDLDSDPSPTSMTAKDDIEAYPAGLNVPQGEKDEITRTSTKKSWRGLARAVTRTTTKSSWKDPGPPPDGGLTAWTQVGLGHFVIMTTWLVDMSFCDNLRGSNTLLL
jgi:hypothetical protein